ncbi:MAG TPA: lysylphosphatidylglycerol synthase domain-containing protein [Gaiellaceae bacterium]|nr:lysylphosphatidylglycerol synthase domain-containing protein [Gaiellaceae bacterium]
MQALRRVSAFFKAHPRVFVGVQLGLLAIFLGAVGWAARGAFRAAGDDLRNANLVEFGIACCFLAAYYLLFVLGWMRILADWGQSISYPAALRAEMVSMLAKYVPGGVWTPAARVVAARRAGITDGALVTLSMLIEAGISAVAGVIVFVVSLAWVDGVDAPIAPLVAFAVVIAVLLHPRVFCPLASRILRRFGYGGLPPLRASTMAFLLVFYSGTWVVGGVSLWFLLRSVGARPELAAVVFLGGVGAVGAIVAVLSVFAPSGLGPREASMYGLMLAVASSGAALGATVLNRVAITLVEVLLLLVGALVLRGSGEEDEERLRTSDRLTEA